MSSSKDHTLRLWDLNPSVGSGDKLPPKCVAVGMGHTEGVGCVCMSTRLSAYFEKRVAAFSASGDKIIKRWNLRPALEPTAAGADTPLLQATHSVRGHDKDINTVMMSPNDAILASGGQDKMVKLWKADDLSAVATLRGHKRGTFPIYYLLVFAILQSAILLFVWVGRSMMITSQPQGGGAPVAGSQLGVSCRQGVSVAYVQSAV